MDAERTAMLVEIARLYYEHGLSQQQVAQKFGVSRPGISRMLQSARDQGIVTITINDPDSRGTRLETELIEKFSLNRVVVIPDDGESYGTIQKRLGQAAVQLLDKLICDDLTLAVSWGTTMQSFAAQINRQIVNNMTVVQLNGGISRAEYDTHASEIAQTIGEKCRAIPYLLPLPAIVDDPEVKAAIISDRHIAHTLQLAQDATVAFFTIGSFSYDSVLVKADYFEEIEVAELLNQGAVGDICSRIIDREGKICSPALDDRTIGIDLEELRKKQHSIAVAGGRDKLPAIKAGLIGRWFNTLITDEWVANQLLRPAEE